MKKRLLGILAFLLVALLLFGCGAKSNDAAEIAPESAGGTKDKDVSYTADSSTATNTKTTEQKLVRKVWITAETDDLDTLLSNIDGRIGALEGYVESREVYNGSQYASRRNRNANLVIRIPAARLDEFVSGVTASANVVSANETVENITLTYADTDSRRKALEVEQTRLLELLAQASSMEDILKIEERLTQVRTELEEVTSRLRVYDNMVDYATVTLTISEVREYTVTEEPETVGQRIGAGLKNTFKTIGNFLVELFIFLVVGSPYLVILAGVIVLVVVLKKRKGRKAKKTEE
jgi:hypothetical protein